MQILHYHIHYVSLSEFLHRITQTAARLLPKSGLLLGHDFNCLYSLHMYDVTVLCSYMATYTVFWIDLQLICILLQIKCILITLWLSEITN